ncbi:MAG TPA: FGGY family carbohydrate kinase [Steroidobacteraceae bacterium]|nr:FGGY family carbohydrate kinase [Steroidobacteraceae bacterium]
MREPLYLAVDQGGHASRALVFERDGRALTSAFAAIGTARNALGHVEHDGDELLLATRQAIDDVAQHLGARVRDIAAAGLVTQRSTIVCWDRATGAPLSPAISWQDRRNAKWLDRFAARAEWIKSHTGLVLSPHYGASKMRWCLDHLQAVKRAAAERRLAVGPLSSFLAFRLIEDSPFIVDPANASRTLLYDPDALDWSAELLDVFGIARELLPLCRSSIAAHGVLRVAQHPVPLTVMTGDQSAVPFAWGAPADDCVFVNVGTGAFAQRALGVPLPGGSGLLESVVLNDGHRSTRAHEGTVNGAGSALQWFAEAEGVDSARMLEALDSTDVAALNPPLFLNGVSGLGSPFWVSDFDTRFLGTGTTLEKFVAVVESIAFLIRVNVDEMRRTEPPIRTLILTGGLTRSDYFCRCLAELVELDVRRMDEPEASARGVACLAAGLPESWRAGAQTEFDFATNGALLARYVAWLRNLKQNLATR